MAHHCGTETVLAMAGWGERGSSYCLQDIGKLPVEEKQRDTMYWLLKNHKHQGLCILLLKRYFIGLHIIKATARPSTQNSNLEGL